MALGIVWFISILITFVHLTPLIVPEEERNFKEWMIQHNKVYSTEEYYYRLQQFTENKKIIDHHNAGNHSFTMGLNQFSDMSFEEFRKFYLLTLPQNCSATQGHHHVRRSRPNPQSVDWRKKGNIVTPVKNQGHCGSCWTFATTGCLESVNAIVTGKLVPLSEQQLVDCAHDFKNYGCMGGLPSQAFEYIKYNKGLMTEENYPYTGHQDTCNFKPSHAAAFVWDVVNITAYDEKAMIDAVAWLNPISFAFEVTADFMHYKKGVYYRLIFDNIGFKAVMTSKGVLCFILTFTLTVAACSSQCEKTADMVNHAVLAVGYGAQKRGKLYWIVKNSWGTAWGMDGYFWIQRGKNMCGLATCASYPLPLVH